MCMKKKHWFLLLIFTYRLTFFSIKLSVGLRYSPNHSVYDSSIGMIQDGKIVLI